MSWCAFDYHPFVPTLSPPGPQTLENGLWKVLLEHHDCLFIRIVFNVKQDTRSDNSQLLTVVSHAKDSSRLSSDSDKWCGRDNIDFEFSIQAADLYDESSQSCVASGCCGGSNKRCCKSKGVASASLNVSHRSGRYNVATGTYYASAAASSRASPVTQKSGSAESCWADLPKVLALSIGSIIMPLAYSNDARQHHPRIKVKPSFWLRSLYS